MNSTGPAVFSPVRLTLSAALALICLAAPLPAQDTAKLGKRPGRQPVKLWPPTGEKKDKKDSDRPLEINGWTYRAVKSANPRDGVPWELIVEPAGRNAEMWHKGAEDLRSLPLAKPKTTIAIGASKGQKPEPNPEDVTVPVITIPQVVWQQQMDTDLQKAVGIHFHEMVTDDVARILFTVHKVPADGPPDKADSAAAPPGVTGSRIEATLLAPVIFSLDQTIAIRKDQLDKDDLIESRSQHELGHALMSQDVFLAVLRGTQDWNLAQCTGRHSRFVYYWKRERIGRSWDGYRDNVGKLLTLRTSVVIVPPTRWSVLVPLPPERVTQQQIQSFNDSIVQAVLRFDAVDREAQKQYHATHGAFESAEP